MEQVIDFVSVAFQFRNDLRQLQDGTNDLYFGWLTQLMGTQTYNVHVLRNDI